MIVYLKLGISVMLIPENTPIKCPTDPVKGIFEIFFDVIYIKLIILQKSTRSHHSGLNFSDISRLVVL